MKSKMRKKLIAFMLCMVLVICNSVSILADTPAAETTTAGEQVKETRTAKNENASDDKTGGEDEKNVSKQSEESDKDTPPEVTTTEKKKETTETTTEKKEETTTEASTEKKETTTAAKDETTETTTEDKKTTETTTEEKATTEAAEETSTTGKKEETDEAEESSETSKTTAETTEETSTKTTEASTETIEETAQSPAFDGKYEDETVIISVNAEAGIVPEGAELSVTPIEKTEITDDMSEEAKAEAEQINAQYDLTEKKLTEDSEANEETMQGFLAYDISFIVNGEEVEPSGDVKVVMDFKEAAIPEGVSETADISVKHLKEDASAADGIVVEDMGEKVTVEATEKAEVEKAEFTAESFSVFTVQWTWKGQLYEIGDIEVHVVDENGQPLEIKEDSFQDSDLNATVEEIAEQIKIVEDGDYRFSYASIGGIQGDKISALGINYGEKQYKKVGEDSWSDINNRKIYFVFSKRTIHIPDTIETEDTDDFIKLNLFDYVVGRPDEYNELNQQDNDWAGDNTGINVNHPFKFQSNSGGREEEINKSGSPNQGIVEAKLGSDGFPVLNIEGSSNDKSLAYLFNNSTTAYKSAHLNLNKLFTYTDSTRKYSYNSDENYAYFDTANENKDFVVYADPANIGGYHGFFPFSKYEDVEGTSRGPETGVGLDCNDRQNHYFGMTMTTTFMQPKDGMISEMEPMVFSFSGDDDVWVYVDGVLVMDIGGTHNAVSGTIDFSTGKITVAGQETYIGQILKENGVSESKLDGNKLKDYEQFELKFFYLERGNYDSNCKLEFNLAMINQNSVSVGKQITDVDTSKYGDVQFKYLIEVGENQSSLAPYKERKYKIYNVEDRSYTGQTGTTDEYGHFFLKHNQMAVFENDSTAGTSGIDEDLYYQVTELNVNSQEYNDVHVNQTDIVSQKYNETVSNDGTITGNTENEQYDAESPVYQVSETGQVIFYNRCSAYNKRELHIQKKMKTGQTSSDTFNVNVKLNDEPYVGNYILITTEGNKEDKTTPNGVISLNAGEEAVISEIPADTMFEVVEQTESLSTEYKKPQYQVKNGGNSTDTNEQASGKIVLGQDAEVIVTNSITAPDALFIEVQKTFSGLDRLSVEEWNSLKETFKINVYDSTGDEILKTLTLNDPDCKVSGSTYSWKIEIAPTDIDGSNLAYQIQEEGAKVEEYELTVTVNGKEVSVTGDTSDKVPVSVTNPMFTIVEGSGERAFIEENSCSQLQFNFETNFIAGRVQRKAENNYIVWTKDELSAMERSALVSLIKQKENAGMDWNDMSVPTTLFYSDEGDSSIRDGISIAGEIVKLDENNTLKFSNTNQWQKVCGGFYEKTAGQDAEIAITNSYKPETINIDLQKYGTDFQNEQLSGAEFSLYEGTYDSEKINILI